MVCSPWLCWQCRIFKLKPSMSMPKRDQRPRHTCSWAIGQAIEEATVSDKRLPQLVLACVLLLHRAHLRALQTVMCQRFIQEQSAVAAWQGSCYTHS